MSDLTWVIAERVGGMGRPGDGPGASLELELAELSGRGVGTLVSLTEEPLPRECVEREGMEYIHLPLRDMTAPNREQMDAFCRSVADAERRDKAVAVHCGAGLGRTGTMLAAYLVWLGAESDEAIARVRAARPGSIETAEQEAAVALYAASLKELDER